MPHPELRQNSDWELCQSEWELLGTLPIPLLCSRPASSEKVRGAFPWSPGISLSHAKLMLQLHWGFQNLTLSFLFAPLSCSLSLTICLSVSIKCCIKYLLACLCLHHLFLRGKELCATVLWKEEDKTNPGLWQTGSYPDSTCTTCYEFWFVLRQQTPHVLSFFSSTPHQIIYCPG